MVVVVVVAQGFQLVCVFVIAMSQPLGVGGGRILARAQPHPWKEHILKDALFLFRPVSFQATLCSYCWEKQNLGLGLGMEQHNIGTCILVQHAELRIIFFSFWFCKRKKV